VGEQSLLHFHRQASSLVLKTASLEVAFRAPTIVNKAQESCLEGHRINLVEKACPKPLVDPPDLAH
jgi:hypothetical protein